MAQYVTAYLATVVVFLGIDAIWLSQIARNFYFERLGSLLLDKPNMAAAAGFYLVYVVGVVVLAVMPALRTGVWSTALINGAILGLVAYGTYDMTNYATLKNWPVSVVVVDIAWGTVLTAGSALAGYFITRAISGAGT